ncbi:hypothetical protein M409DRAFT_70363 [Zasmidium cellare ATCC 36951]|uniref:Malate dehydrogenase n=1 Tax=Zasmidium cellare ATCC 36951 TaxID=1080233 RepID=A0A6A6C0Y4_ZASCE|nr:uncharacterized protein M409DRAFT_70363 [Zasmidium cellare ATCC 36951]KAF2160625.1 hypothetical protein M409DRAFT_70363 [Zasmidium cellare ATCC 36951]
MADNPILVDAIQAQEWASSLLQHAGVSSEHAKIVADSFVLADLRGVDTHGLSRLSIYIARVQAGSINPNPELKILQKTPVMASIDAQDTFGFVAAHVATNQCMKMAETFGVGITAVKNSGHIGMAATYAIQAMEHGYAAILFSNSSPAIAPWGSKEPLWGTNPLAVGFPGGAKGDFLLDIAARRGESIPEGWMLDGQGHPTTDAAEALKDGTVLPIGGAKGSGLAAVVDIFAGLLTGAAFAGSILNQREHLSKRSGQGQWIMVFKPDVLLDSKEEYLERMDTLLERVRSCDLAPGFAEVLTPGENSAKIQEERKRSGIPYKKADVDSLNELAVKIGYNVKFA